MRTSVYGINICLNLMPVRVMKRFFTSWRISNPRRRSLSGKFEPTMFYHIIQLGKNWIPMGFLVMREVSKNFPFATPKYSVWFSH